MALGGFDLFLCLRGEPSEIEAVMVLFLRVITLMIVRNLLVRKENILE